MREIKSRIGVLKEVKALKGIETLLLPVFDFFARL